MTANEKLNRVREGYLEFQRMSLKLEELETLATKITPVLSDMPKGDNPNPKDESWARLIDYKKMCQSKFDTYLQDCKDLEQELHCIRSTNIRTAMSYYYIDRCKQEDIAEVMGYSDREIRYYLQKGRKIYEEAYYRNAN